MSLDQPREALKPYVYPWAFDAWQAQQQAHWLPEEVPLADDVKDWHNKLTAEEKNLVTQIFRFFTQADVEVNNCYHRHYLRIFRAPEVTMMLTAFSSMETIHVVAYSHLLDTIGMPEIEYTAFLRYKEMKEKSDYMRAFNPDNPFTVAETLAAFGAFTEGLQLFASFAILLNFQRFNKLKGCSQIVTWSVRDESIHCNSVIRLFHQWLAEHPEIDRDALAKRIRQICEEIVEHEDAFIDLAFEMGGVEGLEAEDVKKYIRYIGDLRMNQLGYDAIYNIGRNPLPWMDVILNAIEHTNFFENRATEYSKSATQGSWEDAFSGFDGDSDVQE
jgi:ribonucleoside-diphosphate reductase beta chain